MTARRETLLIAKIRPPRRARGVIPRPSLDTLLDAIAVRRLTVAVAPAGFGKTTAALSWSDALAGRGARVAWLSLGPEDDDLEHFLGYLEAALGDTRVGIPLGDTGATTPNFAIPLEQRLNWIFDRIAVQTNDIFLFLDDFHLISEPAILSALSLLLRCAPDNLHLVVLSRREVPLGLQQWRVRDDLVELDGSALQFSVDETRNLLERGGISCKGTDQAPALHALTGGWIAALRAALLTMRSRGESPHNLSHSPGTLRSIGSLFADLLDSLEPEQAAILVHVSIARRVCSSLVEALSGCANGQAVLDELERQQLFCSCADEQQTWFVFHPLFRGFLERRARESSDVDYVALHKRAAFWHAGACLWSEAIHHALAAGDTRQALGWIEDHAMTLVGDGDLFALLSWERQLRTNLVESPLRLRLAFSWALGLVMMTERALSLLDSVEAAIGSVDHHEQLRVECLALRAVLLSERGDYDQALELAGKCRPDSTAPPWVHNAILNVTASGYLHSGRWEELYALEAPEEDPNDRPGRDRTSLVYRLSIRGVAEYRQGDLNEASRHLELAMEHGLTERGGSDVLVALPAPTLALVLYERNRLEEADRINTRYMDINRRVGPIDGLLGSYRVAARIAWLGGQPVRVRVLLEEAERIAAARGWSRVTAAICLERTRFCLLDGRTAEASANVRKLEALMTGIAGPSLEYSDISRTAALARAWRDLVERNYAAAARGLESQLQQGRVGGKLLDELCAGTALALAWFGEKRVTESLGLFLSICERAAKVEAYRSILDQPVELGQLVERAIAEAAATPGMERTNLFLEKLIEASAAAPVAKAGLVGASSLTPREHHILALISRGLSNKDIARNLGIGSETVKSHAKSIFSKLGVRTRTQAVAKFGGNQSASRLN